MVEEVGSKDRPTNVCYHKNPGKRAPETQVEGERLSSKCGNMRAVGSLEVEVWLGVFPVGGSGREYADCGASVDEECEVIGGIAYM